MLHNKSHVIIILLLFLQVSCTVKSNSQEVSPSENYSFYTSIENFIIIHLVNQNKDEISVIDTRASDVMKWAIGWMPKKDTIVLYSSDIGSYAYIIENQKLIKLEHLTKEMCLRANNLYEKKYNKTSSLTDC